MGPRVHELKTAPPYFEAILRGEKPWEVRRDDRGFNRGDKVILKAYGKDKYGAYNYLSNLEYLTPCFRSEALIITADIGWVLTGGQFGIEPGHVVFTLENIALPANEEG